MGVIFREEIKGTNMKLVYFAHPLSHYDTDFEYSCLEKINNELPDYICSSIEIFNPNQKWLDRLYTKRKEDEHGNPFSIFTEITSICDVCIGVTFNDGKIGSGVFKECETSFHKKKEVYLMVGKDLTIVDFTHPNDYRKKLGIVLSIKETVDRIKKKEM